MSKNLCIIPARGGSKRIPGKNIKIFFGRPIISYSIEAALKSKIFNEIMVSTDDDQIAEIAKKYGAQVPFLRSSKNADDFSTTVDVLLEVIEQYSLLGQRFDNICCLYPTAPFVTEFKLHEAYNKLNQEMFDSVFPVVPYCYPIQRSLRLIKGKITLFNPEHENSRTQDLEEAFHDAGQFYFLKTSSLLHNKTIFSKNTGGIVINDLEAQDIDNETDWKLAELKYELLQKP